MKKQHFPQTLTWLGREIAAGRLDAVREHVMSVYRRPLRIYFLGHSGRWKGDPDELVNGFFADRMGRDDFFEKWQASGRRLHRWLITAFHLFIQEEWQREKRFRRFERFDPSFDVSGFTEDRGAELDKLRVESIARRVMEETERACRSEGMGKHWEILERHLIEGRPYSEFCEEFGVSREQAAVMIRTPKRRAAAILREILEHDGVEPDRIQQEIQDLQEVLHS